MPTHNPDVPIPTNTRRTLRRLLPAAPILGSIALAISAVALAQEAAQLSEVRSDRISVPERGTSTAFMQSSPTGGEFRLTDANGVPVLTLAVDQGGSPLIVMRSANGAPVIVHPSPEGDALVIRSGDNAEQALTLDLTAINEAAVAAQDDDERPNAATRESLRALRLHIANMQQSLDRFEQEQVDLDRRLDSLDSGIGQTGSADMRGIAGDVSRQGRDITDLRRESDQQQRDISDLERETSRLHTDLRDALSRIRYLESKIRENEGS